MQACHIRYLSSDIIRLVERERERTRAREGKFPQIRARKRESSFLQKFTSPPFLYPSLHARVDYISLTAFLSVIAFELYRKHRLVLYSAVYFLQTIQWTSLLFYCNVLNIAYSIAARKIKHHGDLTLWRNLTRTPVHIRSSLILRRFYPKKFQVSPFYNY